MRRRRKKRATPGKKLFYGIYFLLILVFIVGMCIAMNALKDWLVDYEASQPDNRSEAVFEQYFADPDWAQLYGMAKIQDTPFEGVEEYVAYMDEVVGDSEITMVETSGGLGGKKYVIRATLGQDRYYNFATYTLVDGKSEDDLISDWQLGEVEVYTYDPDAPGTMDFDRPFAYRFLIDPGCTVTVNGVTLDDSFLRRTVATVAETYLPEGVHGYRMVELWVDGLLLEPKVEITDAQGDLQDVSFDPETGTYIQNIVTPTITDQERDTVVKAAKTYCEYMIGAVGAWDLRSYYDHTTQIYTTITTNTTWMQGYSGYYFGEETVSGFYRYSDTLYSARVTVSLNVTRSDGTVKVYPLDSTFFLALQGDSWKVIEMTNVDVQARTEQVRVDYMDGDTLLGYEMVDTDSRKLTPPAVTPAQGQSFRGWYVEAGRLEMAADGTVTLPSDYEMAPMTVYALFGEG